MQPWIQYLVRDLSFGCTFWLRFSCSYRTRLHFLFEKSATFYDFGLILVAFLLFWLHFSSDFDDFWFKIRGLSIKMMLRLSIKMIHKMMFFVIFEILRKKCNQSIWSSHTSHTQIGKILIFLHQKQWLQFRLHFFDLKKCNHESSI